MNSSKGKFWFCFYATMVILVIAGFLIIAPKLKKESTIDTNTKLSIEFSTKEINLNVNDTLLFDENILKISTDIDYNDINFCIFDGKESKNLLTEGNSYFEFAPQDAGSYELVALYKDELIKNKSISIKVLEGSNDIYYYNLGESINVSNLLKEQTTLSWDANFEKNGEKLICTHAGLANIYTEKDCEYYHVKMCHQVAILPVVKIDDIEAENNAVHLNKEKRKGFDLSIGVYTEKDSNQRTSKYDLNISSTNEINYELAKPDLTIVIGDANLKEINLILSFTIDNISFDIKLIITLI